MHILYNFLTLVWCLDSHELRAGRSGARVQSRAKKNLCCPKFLTTSGAHRDSYSMGTCVLSWRKRSRSVNVTTCLHLVSIHTPLWRGEGQICLFFSHILLSNELQNSSIRSPKNIDLIYGHRYLMYSERLRQFEGRQYNSQQDT